MRRLALVWVCSALAVVGCSKPDQPGTLPPKPSASPSPSPSVSAQPKDPKAAIVALVKQYYAESNTAIRTGTTKNLRSLTVPGCPCDNFADHVDRDWKNGRVVVQATTVFNVSRLVSPILDSPTVGFVTVIYSSNAYKILDKSGNLVSNIPAHPELASTTVECHSIDGAWKVADVVRN